MWPFSKSKEEIEAIEKQKQDRKRRYDYVEENYPLGKEFVYLGVTCKVIRHHDVICFQPYTTIPGVWCNYVDHKGVIHEKFFRVDILRTLDINKE